MKGYNSRLEAIRIENGHRTVAGLSKERIEGILKPYANRPGAALDTLKKLRILIQHAMGLQKGDPLKLTQDPSVGIKRPEIGEFRAWTDAECAAYEKRWPVGTKQRTAYAVMLYVGAARVPLDVRWHAAHPVRSGRRLRRLHRARYLCVAPVGALRAHNTGDHRRDIGPITSDPAR